MTDNYALEIDFLPVGTGSRSGDAILFRFGIYQNNEWVNQHIFVIDGGDKSSGQAIVDHVLNIYKSDKIDYMILTHPDADHASGLRTVIDQLRVGKILMHCPWNHWSDVQHSIVDGRITKKSFGERMQKAYQYAYDIEKLASQNYIEIVPPHQGLELTLREDVVLTVLGPSKELYTSLIQASGKTPEMGGLYESTRPVGSQLIRTVYEDYSFDTENLADTDIPTSAENDMSLILLLTVGNTRALFTGDAGTQGLFKAIYFATEKNINLRDLDLFQVPHHGSRRNLSKGILKYISAKYSVISCAPQGAPKHPSPIVINALLRRNMNSYATRGTLLRYHNSLAPDRYGMSPIAPLQFSNTVEISI